MNGYTDKEKVAEFLADLKSNPPKLIVEPVVDTSEILPLHMGFRAPLVRQQAWMQCLDSSSKIIVSRQNFTISLCINLLAVHPVNDFFFIRC